MQKYYGKIWISVKVVSLNVTHTCEKLQTDMLNKELKLQGSVQALLAPSCVFDVLYNICFLMYICPINMFKDLSSNDMQFESTYWMNLVSVKIFIFGQVIGQKWCIGSKLGDIFVGTQDTVIYWFVKKNASYHAYFQILIFAPFLAGTWATGMVTTLASRHNQKVGQMSGPFGSTVISTTCFHNSQAWTSPTLIFT